MILQVNQEISKTVSTVTEHYNYMKGRLPAGLLYQTALDLVWCTAPRIEEKVEMTSHRNDPVR